MKTTKASTLINPGRSSQLKLLAAAVALASATLVSRADHFYTNNATGDYNVATFWDPNSVPNDNTHNNNGSNNIVLIQDGDPIWQHGDTLAGDANGASGAYLQTGSTNNTGGGNWLRMGLNPGAYGSYVLSNGLSNVGGRIQIGEQGTGYLEVSGGTMRANANDSGANPGLSAGDGSFNSVANNSPVGTVVLNSGTLNIGNGEVWFGNAGNNINSRGTGHLIMHGGTFNANNWFVFGRFGAAGDAYMDGGVINKNNNGNVQIGVGSMNNGSTAGQGYFTQMGGTFNCASEYQIGTDATITQATNDIGGSAVLRVDNWFAVGRNGAYGVMNISGNAAITKTSANGGNLSIGAGGGGNGGSSIGIVNQNGGTFTNTATQTWIGETGQGTWNMNNGSAILGTVILADTSSGTGNLNLNGGLFRANSVSSGSALAVTTLNFNGGTLQAGAANVNFMSGLTTAELSAGGAVIDSQGFNITIPQTLIDNGGGSLTKLGSGTLTLSGGNTYTGDTVISVGELDTTTASTGAGNYSVADGAALGVAVQSSGAQLNMNNATLGSSTGATVNLNLGSFGNPSSAPVNIAGNLSVNGTITINVAASVLSVGTFSLVHFASTSGSGTPVIGSLPVGVVAHLSVAANDINLVVTSAGQPRWNGNVNNVWDINTTQNWYDLGTMAATVYKDNQPTVFDDNAVGNTSINLGVTVSPLTLNFNNNSLPYSIGGSGKISGATGLTLNGSGTVAIVNTGGNNFTGPVTLNAGVLSVTNLANGGSPSAIGASSSSPNNLVLASGTLSYAGPTVTINRGYSLQGVNTNSTIDTESNLTLSGVVTAGTGDGFIKTGPAQLTYTTVGSNQLSAANYVVQAGSLLLNGPVGGQTNNISGNLSVDGSVTAASATLTNTTVTTGVNVGIGDAANTMGTMEVDSGTTLTVNSWFLLGDGANATASLTMNNGTLNVPNGRLFLCSAPGTMATFNMNGGTINKSGDYFAIVNGGWNGVGARTGMVNQVNGTINCHSECWIGDGGGAGNGSVGYYNLSGGNLNLGSWFGVGRDGSTGFFNMTGGNLFKAGGGDMVIGRGGSSGTFTMSAGTINKDPGNPIIVGQGQGVGEFDISGGTVNSGAEFWVGVDNGTVATNNISGTASMNIHNWVTIGRNGLGVANLSSGQFNSDTQPFIVGIWGGSQGIWNQSGGSLNINEEIWIGQGGGDTNSHGVINLTGGTITNTSWLAVGREAGQGVLNISGGTFVKQGGGNISIAHNTGASGTVNISGTGTFICASGDTWVGENGAPGAWNMNGGTAVLGLVHLAQNADATGVMTLNGGSLTVNEISTGNNTAAQRELDFNGGTLIAGADNTSFIHDLSAANVESGGALINTAGHSVAVNQALLGVGADGGLTKNGNGTLSLNGLNTYTGNTTINAGTLGGAGTINGRLLVNPGAGIAPGNGGIGTLTVNSNITLSAGTTNVFEVNGSTPANDQVVVGTTVTYGGVLQIVPSGALTPGQKFQLFAGPGATNTGNFAAVQCAVPIDTFAFTNGVLTVLTGGPDLTQNRLTNSVTGGGTSLSLSWSPGWKLQAQTNNVTRGLGTNWVYVTDGSVNTLTVPIIPGNPTVFYRLASQ